MLVGEKERRLTKSVASDIPKERVRCDKSIDQISCIISSSSPTRLSEVIVESFWDVVWIFVKVSGLMWRVVRGGEVVDERGVGSGGVF